MALRALDVPVFDADNHLYENLARMMNVDGAVR